MGFSPNRDVIQDEATEQQSKNGNPMFGDLLEFAAE